MEEHRLRVFENRVLRKIFGPKKDVVTEVCIRRHNEDLRDFYSSPYIIRVIIIIFLHGLGRLTCSGIDTLPSFPGAYTISSSSRFAVEGVFRKSGVFHFFKMVYPVLFAFGSHVLYSRDI